MARPWPCLSRQSCDIGLHSFVTPLVAPVGVTALAPGSQSQRKAQRMYCNTPRVGKTGPSWSVDIHHGKAVIFLVLTSLSFGGCSGKPSSSPSMTDFSC